MKHEIVPINSDLEVRFCSIIDEGRYVAPHWHNSMEIVYLLEGSITVALESKKVEVLPEEFIIINPRTIHAFTSQKNRALLLQIPSAFFDKYVPNIDLLYFAVDMHPKSEIEITNLNIIKKIFHDMYEVYEARPEGYLLKFNSLLYDMLFKLIHLYSYKLATKQINKNNKYLKKLKEITLFLNAHHNEHITIRQLADEVGYNSDYVARLFKKHMGLTIIEYLYEIRINYVYQDLINSNLSIKEIFENHGCGNYRVAMHLFKKRYGCTPKEKRKQIKTDNIKKSE